MRPGDDWTESPTYFCACTNSYMTQTESQSNHTGELMEV